MKKIKLSYPLKKVLYVGPLKVSVPIKIRTLHFRRPTIGDIKSIKWTFNSFDNSIDLALLLNQEKLTRSELMQLDMGDGNKIMALMAQMLKDGGAV